MAPILYGMGWNPTRVGRLRALLQLRKGKKRFFFCRPGALTRRPFSSGDHLSGSFFLGHL